MKSIAVLYALTIFGSIASAIPVEKRELIWFTDYVQVVETIFVAKTVWVDPTSFIQTSTSTSVWSLSSSTTYASSTPSSLMLSSSTSTSSDLVEDYFSTSYMNAVPVATTTTIVTSSTTPAASSSIVTLTPSTSPLPSSTTSAPAAASPTSTVYSGDMTYYDVGLGSCGWTSEPSDYIVALSTLFMKNPANPNNNPLCGQTIIISYGGKQTQAKVVDTCEGCSYSSIDMSDSLFTYFADMSLGRVHNVQWSFL